MKKTFLCVILLALLAPCLLAASGQEERRGVQEAQVIAKKAKIYLEATPFSTVIDTVARGTVVALFSSGKKTKKWLYISYYSIKRNAQVTGFVKADNVEIFQENPGGQQDKAEEKIVEADEKEASPPAELLDELKIEKAETEKELSSAGADLKKTKTAAQGSAKADTVKSSEAEKQMEEKEESFEQEKKEMTEEVGPDTKQEIQKEESKITGESALDEKVRIQDENTSIQEQEPAGKKAGRNNGGEKEKARESKEREIQKNQDSFQKTLTEEKEHAEGQETKRTAQEGEKKESGLKEALKVDIPEKIEEQPLAGAEEEKNMEAEKEALPQVLTKVSIKVQMANIRLMPSLQSAVIHQLPSGVELKTLARAGNWYRVNLPPNESGIVLSGYIHHSIVDEIYESVQPAVEPEEKPVIMEKEPVPAIEPEKKVEPAVVQTAASGLPLWIGGGAGYTLPSESRFAKGINFGGTVGLEIMKHLALELRVPYFQSNVSGSFEGLSSGQLKNLSFMLSVQARYPLNDQLVPYIVGGGDYHWNKFSLDDAVKSSWNDLGFTMEEKVSHSFGFHIGAGVDFFVWPNIALNLDVRYFTANLNGTWSLINQANQQQTTGNIESMKLNSMQAGISIKFFLGR